MSVTWVFGPNLETKTYPMGSFLVNDRFRLGLACDTGIVEPSILSVHPAKYLHVSMLIPTCVFNAKVYTAPESMDSIVASSSLCSCIRSASLKMRKILF